MGIEQDTRFWDKAAAKYAANPVADPEGYTRTLDAARKHIAGNTVLEFGSGTGTTAIRLAPDADRYVATDISVEMLNIARERAAKEGVSKVEFVMATPETAPFDPGSFDVAIGFNILHLVKSRPETLRALHRLLKPGGLLITKTPCLREMSVLGKGMVALMLPVMQAIGRAPHVGSFSIAQLEAEMAEAGFNLLERARHGSKPKPEPRIYLVAQKR
jgi:ubiquinone/menaquinone biosynthesis C-methylase UbiE